MEYREDNRIIMTLDAGGTNFVFSAIMKGEVIVHPVTLSAVPNDLTLCLNTLKEGFLQVKEKLPVAPAAISFAFPGPADYQKGIIGDLPNFPAFTGGVALASFLEEQFGIPVFINNDGNLFAYGEALTGVLPEINRKLKAAGSNRQYRNLIGLTLGTGFGAGVVINGELLTGDNGSGGDIWCLRNKKYPQYIIEESVSIRAVKRVYQEYSGDTTDLTPHDIFRIAEGLQEGNREAAIASFEELGEMAGDGIASAITLIDGIVVLGGGLTGASKYIVPALIKELTSNIGMMDGSVFSRVQEQVFDLDNTEQFEAFAKDSILTVTVPGTTKTVEYDPVKRTGVIISTQGASHSIAMGAYMFALNQLNKK